MHYQEALEYISAVQSRLVSAYSLEPVRCLCELAGRPDRGLAIIHIAGTNGKGSVGTYLSNILALSGYTVGRYVSPVLSEYRERIQKVYAQSPESAGEESLPLRCTYISEQETAEELTRLRHLVAQMERQGENAPTAFEIETVMAFQVMRQWGVDVAVIETGMGGRTDATNIIESPLLCLFSSIGLDHTAWLGDTVTEIAAEKYGIIKPGADVVTVRQENSCMELLWKRCAALGVTPVVADREQAEEIRYSIDGTTFSYQGQRLRLGQAGTYQVENALAAWEAAQCLKRRAFPAITLEAARQALRQSRWKGRFERVAVHPDVIVDGAHNPQAASELRRSLTACFPGERFSMVIGVFRDKDYARMLETMLPLAETVYTVTPPGTRGLSAEELGAWIGAWKERQSDRENAFGLARQQTVEEGRDFVTVCRGAADALQKACKGEDKVVVFGSLSFLHEVYEWTEARKG